MFDLIEDRKRPEIKWWTVPAAVFLIFCTGVNAGILIGRRTIDPVDWLQMAFLVVVIGRVLWPIGREFVIHRAPGREK
jgi:hypothetical protein